MNIVSTYDTQSREKLHDYIIHNILEVTGWVSSPRFGKREWVQRVACFWFLVIKANISFRETVTVQRV